MTTIRAEIHIDKITVCIDPDLSDQKHIEEWFAEQYKRNYGYAAGNKKANYYRLNRLFPLTGLSDKGKESQLLVSANPYNTRDSKMPFLRLRWNPSKIGINEFAALKKIVGELLPGGYSKLYSEGWITSIDIALDIYNGPHLVKLLIYDKRKIMSGTCATCNVSEQSPDYGYSPEITSSGGPLYFLLCTTYPKDKRITVNKVEHSA